MGHLIFRVMIIAATLSAPLLATGCRKDIQEAKAPMPPPVGFGF